MADNTILPLGTEDGDTYASDDIGGVKYQRVKVTLGADGTNDGDVSATNPVPIDGTVSGSGTFTTKETRSSTATTSQVADTASSTTLLASNSDRLGATIENDSSATLYVKFGTTASTTDYTVKLVQNAYYEVPFNYTGRIDGIWATDPGDGAARITELT